MTEKQAQLQIYLAIVKCIIASHKSAGASFQVLARMKSDKEREDAVMQAEKEYTDAMDHCLALLEKAAS